MVFMLDEMHSYDAGEMGEKIHLFFANPRGYNRNARMERTCQRYRMERDGSGGDELG